MLRYCFILAIAVALIFAGSTTIWAQDTTTYCELLSAEDCELLHDSAQAMRDVTSIETQVNVDMLVKNIPEVPFEELSVNVTQYTAFALDDDAAQILADLRQMSPDDMTFLFQRTEEVFNLYFDVLTGSTFDTELTVSVSEDVAQIISEEADAGFDLPSSIGFGVRLLDGIMYVNLSSFADALPGIRTTGAMWLGFEFAPVLDLAAADADFGEIGEEEAATLAQFASGMGGVSGGPLITTLGATEMTELLLPYVDVERLPDDELDGNGVAVFRTVIDYQYLSGDPIFQSLLAELLGDESLIGIRLSDLEIEQIVGMAEVFGPDLLASLGLELTR
ncbi:hypothetical protein KFU94_62440 [Chloroflexi bacterium TSY]|nr:hypothetical protein [Chloroflexi bacterium TSY]